MLVAATDLCFSADETIKSTYCGEVRSVLALRAGHYAPRRRRKRSFRENLWLKLLNR
jgi:ribosomal protein L20